MIYDDVINIVMFSFFCSGAAISLCFVAAGLIAVIVTWKQNVLKEIRSILLFGIVDSLLIMLGFLWEDISTKEQESYAYCAAIGFWTSYTQLVITVWATMMSIMPLAVSFPMSCTACGTAKVCLGMDHKTRLARWTIIVYVVSLALPLINEAIFIGMKAYGPDNYGCWVFTGDQFADTQELYNIVFYSLYQMIGFVITLICGIMTLVKTRKHVRAVNDMEVDGGGLLVERWKGLTEIEVSIIKRILVSAAIFTISELIELLTPYAVRGSSTASDVVAIIIEFMIGIVPFLFLLPYLLKFWKLMFTATE